MPELSVVVPVYNEEKTLAAFLARLRAVLAGVTEDYEVIFALDPCADKTEEMILAARADDARIKLLRFSRRFGQPAATWAGLARAAGRATLVIDCDLQDPPELIAEMFRLWRDEGYQVVIPQRRSREGENFIKRAIAYSGYWFINKTATVEIPRNTGDFRLLDARVVEELMKLNESHGFLRGLTALVGFKTKLVPFDRQPRADGRGKYNSFTGSLTIGFNGVVAFSGSLLRMMGVAGFAMAALAVFSAIAMILAKLFGWMDFAVGLTTLGVLMLFLTGCQLTCMGVLGAYIGRIYEESKRRPKYIVERAVGFD